MILLGIETSTAVCSVGLARQSTPSMNTSGNVIDLISEKSLVESHIHSEKLLTLIQELCDEQQLNLSQVDGVAVSIGPGSFTGLRIGLSTAKGLSFALEKPLVAVPTFESIAKSALMLHPECDRIIVCIDAKQREYYIGTFEQLNGTVQEVLEVHIGTLSSVVQSILPKTLIVTDQMNEWKKELPGSVLIQEVFSYCRGDMVARLAMEQWTAETNGSWNQLEPKYLKDFVVRMQSKSGT
jgi:tRNA threonylcarbamoyladenosine biosynthesis protein TsaB